MMQQNNCQNCNEPITANFCSHCGQKKYKRIDKKYIWDELQYTLFHTNKGFLYSIKKILRNPGKTAKEFIDGNRVNHYKPILLVFVLSGIATFISFKILHYKEAIITYYENQNLNMPILNHFSTFVSTYNSLLMLLYVPLFAIITRWVLKKWGHNFYEHVIMNAYILAYYLIINILFIYPFLYFVKDKPLLTVGLTQMSILLMPFILVGFFKEVYPQQKLKAIILRTLGIMSLTFVGYVLLIILTILLGIIYALWVGPEALQQFKVK